MIATIGFGLLAGTAFATWWRRERQQIEREYHAVQQQAQEERDRQLAEWETRCREMTDWLPPWQAGGMVPGDHTVLQCSVCGGMIGNYHDFLTLRAAGIVPGEGDWDRIRTNAQRQGWTLNAGGGWRCGVCSRKAA